MDYQEFLQKLRETPRDWFISEDGCIRSGQCCPITAIHPDQPEAEAFCEVSEELGIDPKIADLIVHAADRVTFPDSQSTRRDLLLACGLTEA